MLRKFLQDEQAQDLIEYTLFVWQPPRCLSARGAVFPESGLLPILI